MFFGHTASNYKLFSISALSSPLPYFHPFLITRFQIPHAIFSSRIRTLLLLLFFNKTKFPKKTHLFSFLGHTASNYKLFLSVVSYFHSVFQQNQIPKKIAIFSSIPNFSHFQFHSCFSPFPFSYVLTVNSYNPAAVSSFVFIFKAKFQKKKKMVICCLPSIIADFSFFPIVFPNQNPSNRDEMAEIVFAVAGKVLEYLVSPIGRQLSYLFCYRSHAEKLRNQVQKLRTARNDQQITVDEATRKGDAIRPAVTPQNPRVR